MSQDLQPENVRMVNRRVEDVSDNKTETVLKLEYIRLLQKIGNTGIYLQCGIHGYINY